jgi:hypothetical protein
MVPADSTRMELLRETLRHAVRSSPYYASALKHVDLNVATMDDLRQLPLLSRETLTTRSLNILVHDAVPEYFGITSGKTYGQGIAREPLLHFHTEEERLTRLRLVDSLRDPSSGLQPLILRLISANHGLDYGGGYPGCIAMPLEKRYHFTAILAVLRKEFPFEGFTPRVKMLVGPLNMLKLLTLLCIENEVSTDEFQVDSVTSHSWHLTGRWRSLLGSYWHAHVGDCYGLSEAPGVYALRCAICDYFHFSPLAITEVLRIDGEEPIERGAGRLVITTLFPIVQAQPLIRYDTDDLIEIVGTCPATGQVGFEFLGRRTDTVLIQDGNDLHPVLTPRDINEVMDAVPEIATQENPRAKVLALRSMFGWQKYAFSSTQEGERLRIDLAMELRWSPMQYPAAAEAFKENMQQRILNAAPLLAELVGGGIAELQLSLAEPGSTDMAALF